MQEYIPKKYQKHKSLVLLGLKTQDELDRDLTRFKSGNISEIESTILSRIDVSRRKTAYLLSLIPRDNYQKLPNCVISCKEDFERLKQLLSAHPETQEVWAFPKEVEASIGRFAIKSHQVDIDQSQIVEQIWSTNHRDIEHYDGKKNVPIICASRARWGTRYSIDRAENIPEAENNRYHNEFVEAVLNIERKREKIEEITEYFNGLGIESFSLEYRVDSKGFSFIDWDTSHDEKVLNDLFPSSKKDEERIEDDER